MYVKAVKEDKVAVTDAKAYTKHKHISVTLLGTFGASKTIIQMKHNPKPVNINQKFFMRACRLRIGECPKTTEQTVSPKVAKYTNKTSISIPKSVEWVSVHPLV